MTCIVGVIEKKKVWVGSDSAASDGWHQTAIKQPKVFLLQNKFLIGYTTSFRMGQILQYSFKPPIHKLGVSIQKYMINHFVNSLRKCYSNYGFAKKEKEQDKGGECLVGYKGHLFRIQDDYSILESLYDYDSTGSGYMVSLGALYTLSKEHQLGKKDVEIALSAASNHIATVSGPYTIKGV